MENTGIKELQLSWKKNLYVNPDPKSKSCDFQAAVFIIYVLALDSELFELELVASTSELLSATSYP